MPRNKKPKRQWTTRSPGGVKLTRRNTLKALFDRAREVVGLKKSEPKMDDTQSANSEYNTAPTTTPFERGGLTKSAKKRQKIARSVMRETGVLFGNIRPDELMKWSQTALDELRREEDRVEAVRRINETIEETDDWLERQIIRKMLANWGLNGCNGKLEGGELEKEMDQYEEGEKREKSQLIREIGEQIPQNQLLATTVKQLLLADSDRLQEVIKLLTRPLASPTPADPAPVTPKISQTFACRVTRATPSPKNLGEKKENYLPPVTGGPPAPPMSEPPSAPPPPPPFLLNKGGAPPPPPPPPPNFDSKPKQPDPFEKSARTATLRIGRHDRRGLFPGLFNRFKKLQEISEDEKLMLDRLFPHVESSWKRRDQADEHRQLSFQRGLTISIVTDKLEYSQLEKILRRLEDGSAQVEEELAMKILKCWPTDEEIKNYGPLPIDSLQKAERFCAMVAKADRVKIKRRLETIQITQSLLQEVEGLQKEVGKWEKATKSMNSEFFHRLMNTLLIWTNYLNQGSSLAQLDAMGMKDLENIIGKRCTGGDKPTIGQVVARHLGLQRAEVEQLKQGLEGDGKPMPLPEIRREMMRVDMVLKEFKQKLEEEMTLKRDFGAFGMEVERKLNLLTRQYKQMMAAAMKAKEDLNEEDESTEEKYLKDEHTVANLIEKEKTVLANCLDAIQKNELSDTSSARTKRSQSLAALSNQEDDRDIGARTTPSRFSLRQSKKDELLDTFPPDIMMAIKKHFR